MVLKIIWCIEKWVRVNRYRIQINQTRIGVPELRGRALVCLSAVDKLQLDIL